MSPSSSSGEAESHRIYWQQWLSTAATATTANIPGPGGGISSASSSPPSSPMRIRSRRRQLTTSSAAVRIAPRVAKARDVTGLLRRTLNLASGGATAATAGDVEEFQDSLVLVGTLHVPQDYVLFEHEQILLSNIPQHGGLLAEDHQETVSSTLQPFHLVKTLQAEDNPLAIRDEMMKHLLERQDRLIDCCEQHATHLHHSAPPATVQWFFVPGLGAPTIIPNCVELDGYATTMEDGEYSDDDDEEDDSDDVDYQVNLDGTDEDQVERGMEADDDNDLVDVLPALPEGLVRASLFESSLLFASTSQRHSRQSLTKHQKRESREWRRYLQISQSHNSNPHCLAGHLLKQSSNDKHVWRKVYCLLTEDYMWYVHRIKPWWEQQSYTEEATTNSSLEETIAMSPKHGRISLSQALLLEPNEDFERSPLHRVPHAFQIVDEKGITHSFRASSKSLSRQWMQSISTRLMDCYENSFLENAELIIAEETMARNQRYKVVAVDSLLSKASALAMGSKTSSQASFNSRDKPASAEEKEDENKEWSHQTQAQVDLYMYHSYTNESSADNSIDSCISFQARVLRLGMDVAEYREECRHIQATLLTQVGIQSDRKEKEPQIPLLSAPVRKMVQNSWNTASEILRRATQIASLVQIESGHGSTSKKHSSRSLDTLCHHVEFVITGQISRRSSFLNNNSCSTVGGTTADGFSDATTPSHHPQHHPDDPPPIDLFDRLLLELQRAARFNLTT